MGHGPYFVVAILLAVSIHLRFPVRCTAQSLFSSNHEARPKKGVVFSVVREREKEKERERAIDIDTYSMFSPFYIWFCLCFWLFCVYFGYSNSVLHKPNIKRPMHPLIHVYIYTCVHSIFFL